ncbi:MAG: hypothetical protein KGI79_01705 [Patescibacteria group bacterium]|nr:hypothetical protein [Patescibacteria group bacterium]MDE2116570.1 hypothetical protein [Patescibacteria group bacterium]
MSQKRGPKPKGKVKIEWSAGFAYAIGLIATDGSLSKDGRHISFTSKDGDQIENYRKALGLDNAIGRKARRSEEAKRYFVVQFGDVLFFDFLKGIGITPAKSKTLGPIGVPDAWFFDFLRGAFDGDGYTNYYLDPRWRSSHMFYIGFCSASIDHLLWIRERLRGFLSVTGHISSSKSRSCHQLRFAKNDAIAITGRMYAGADIFLARKKLKIDASLAMMGGLSILKKTDSGKSHRKHARVAKLEDALP